MAPLVARPGAAEACTDTIHGAIMDYSREGWSCDLYASSPWTLSLLRTSEPLEFSPVGQDLGA